jgi:hypothetical protein
MNRTTLAALIGGESQARFLLASESTISTSFLPRPHLASELDHDANSPGYILSNL